MHYPRDAIIGDALKRTSLRRAIVFDLRGDAGAPTAIDIFAPEAMLSPLPTGDSPTDPDCSGPEKNHKMLVVIEIVLFNYS